MKLKHNDSHHRGHKVHRILFFSVCSVFCVVILGAQNPEPRTGTQTPAPRTENHVIVDPASLVKPLADEWPTFAGDYTSRRYSTLKQINTTNVKNLTLAWMTTVATGPRGGVPPTIIGGVGTREVAGGKSKGPVLQVGSVL